MVHGSTKHYNNNNLSFLSSFTLSPFSLSTALTYSFSLNCSFFLCFCMSISLYKHYLWIIASEWNLIHPNNRFIFFGKVCIMLEENVTYSACYIAHFAWSYDRREQFTNRHREKGWFVEVANLRQHQSHSNPGFCSSKTAYSIFISLKLPDENVLLTLYIYTYREAVLCLFISVLSRFI